MSGGAQGQGLDPSLSLQALTLFFIQLLTVLSRVGTHR